MYWDIQYRCTVQKKVIQYTTDLYDLLPFLAALNLFTLFLFKCSVQIDFFFLVWVCIDARTVKGVARRYMGVALNMASSAEVAEHVHEICVKQRDICQALLDKEKQSGEFNK